MLKMRLEWMSHSVWAKSRVPFGHISNELLEFFYLKKDFSSPFFLSLRKIAKIYSTETIWNSLKLCSTQASVDRKHVIWFLFWIIRIVSLQEQLLHIRSYSPSANGNHLKTAEYALRWVTKDREKNDNGCYSFIVFCGVLPLLSWDIHEKKTTDRNQLETLAETIFASTNCAHVTRTANSSVV